MYAGLIPREAVAYLIVISPYVFLYPGANPLPRYHNIRLSTTTANKHSLNVMMVESLVKRAHADILSGTFAMSRASRCYEKKTGLDILFSHQSYLVSMAEALSIQLRLNVFSAV